MALDVLAVKGKGLCTTKGWRKGPIAVRYTMDKLWSRDSHLAEHKLDDHSMSWSATRLTPRATAFCWENNSTGAAAALKQCRRKRRNQTKNLTHPMGNLSNPRQQAGNQSVLHAHLVWKGKVVTVFVPPRPDLRVHSQ